MTEQTTSRPEQLREAVRDRYAQAARAVGGDGCCGSGCGCGGPTDRTDPVSRELYPAEELSTLPEGAVALSLGCGNPTALAELRPGQVVLDLGSGGGIDVLLSARRVAPGGRAYGLDMTPEMLEVAQRNQEAAGVGNAEFLLGAIEDIPLPDSSVDVIISNCVVNLSVDKPAVFREAYRVLRPGGRLAVSDVVLLRSLPERLQPVVALWTGCVSGALLDADYRAGLAEAGFTDVGIETTRVYDADDLADVAAGMLPDVPEDEVAGLLAEVDGAVVSAFVRATKPTHT